MSSIFEFERKVSDFRQNRTEEAKRKARETLIQLFFSFGGFHPEAKGIIWNLVSSDSRDEIEKEDWFGVFDKKPEQESNIIVFPPAKPQNQKSNGQILATDTKK